MGGGGAASHRTLPAGNEEGGEKKTVAFCRKLGGVDKQGRFSGQKKKGGKEAGIHPMTIPSAVDRKGGGQKICQARPLSFSYFHAGVSDA